MMELGPWRLGRACGVGWVTPDFLLALFGLRSRLVVDLGRFDFDVVPVVVIVEKRDVAFGVIPTGAKSSSISSAAAILMSLSLL